MNKPFIMVWDSWLGNESEDDSDFDTPLTVVEYFAPLGADGQPNDLSYNYRMVL